MNTVVRTDKSPVAVLFPSFVVTKFVFGVFMHVAIFQIIYHNPTSVF